MVNYISAADLEDWAIKEPREAQEILPQLVIKLILANSDKVKDFNFPIDKAIQYAGYDGVLTSGENTGYFPEGKSVWEFGTDVNILNKFNNDIEKRSVEPLGVDVKDTVFIFATIKIWNHQTSIEETINKSKDKYKWKDIRIIDASKMSLWLSECPSVSVWMCEVMGKDSYGTISLDRFWEENCFTTTPNLNEQFFLQGRDSRKNEVIEWVNDKQGYRVVKAESSLESILFIIAVIRTLKEKQMRRILSRSLIVCLPEVWTRIIGQVDNNTILIPFFNFTEDIRCPNNVFAILPVSKFSPISKILKNIKVIDLPKQTKDDFHKCLEIIDIRNNDYDKIEKETKRCFLTFYRRISNIPTRRQPKWAASENLRDLIPMAIVGGWNSKLSGDVSIIEKISGMPYQKYIETLSPWLSMEDAPLFTLLNNYLVVSTQELWDFIFDQLTSEDIENLREIVIKVFMEVDPAYDLPQEQWLMASVLGEKSIYSNSLRQGIIISLVMLSERDGEDNVFGIVSTKNYTYSIIKDILDTVKSWKQWFTIVTSLRFLAEASPTAVVEKLSNEIKCNESEFWRLFQPSRDVLGEKNYYVHILWTLENLVWFEETAVTSIMLIANIAEKQIEYKMVNSPLNSLYEIFCIWHPQSCLNYLSRMKIIQRICEKFPITGWKLLDHLLLKGRQICGTISKPSWHDIDYASITEVTNKEIQDSLHFIVSLCVTKLSPKIHQWEIVIKNIEYFQKDIEKLKEKSTLVIKYFTEEERLILCDKIRERINAFRKFPDAEWSVSEEIVSLLEQIIEIILPNTIQKYKYLFYFQPNILNPEPYDDVSSFNYEKEQKKILRLREAAVDEMIDEFGIDVFWDFCAEVQDVVDLAIIIEDKIMSHQYDIVVLRKLKSVNHGLYTSLLWRLFNHNGFDQLLIFIEENKYLSIEEKGQILCNTPMRKTLWDKIEDFDNKVVDYYWKNVRAFRLQAEEKDHEDYYLSQLLKYKRPFSVIHLIAFSDYSNISIIIQTLELCAELQHEREASGLSIQDINYHNIINLFEKIYSDINIDEEKVMQIELLFLNYFKYGGEPKCMLNFLDCNPEQFVILASKIYKPDNVDNHINENGSEEWEFAWLILESFKKVPGCNKDKISRAYFEDWIQSAEEYAELVGYRKAMEICLGRLLSYAPAGTDGIFPHEIVRNYFEEKNSTTVAEEFIVAKRNQRGMHIMTGGKKEHEICLKYRNNAALLRIDYPNTAMILTKIAEEYHYESLFNEKRELLNFNG